MADDDDRRQWLFCDYCRVQFTERARYLVHRTEVHGISQKKLDHLEPGEFDALVDSSDTVGELVDRLGWSSERVLRHLGIYGYGDAVASGRGGDA